MVAVQSPGSWLIRTLSQGRNSDVEFLSVSMCPMTLYQRVSLCNSASN